MLTIELGEEIDLGNCECCGQSSRKIILLLKIHELIAISMALNKMPIAG
jgi:hypothetical protein